MIRYLKMIPVMLYPYAYLIPLIILFNTPAEGDAMARIYLFVFYYAIILHVVVFGLAIENAIIGSKSPSYPALTSAKINLIVKAVQIPAYLFHFVLGCLGLFMSVWGIGIIIFAIVIDAITIASTGISSIGLHVRIRTERYASKKVATWLGIASFLYCIDVAVAVFDYIYVKKIDYDRKNAPIPEPIAPLPPKHHDKKADWSLLVLFIGTLGVGVCIILSETLYADIPHLVDNPIPYQVGFYASLLVVLLGLIFSCIYKNEDNTFGYEIPVEAAFFIAGLGYMIGAGIAESHLMVAVGGFIGEVGLFLLIASVVGYCKKAKPASKKA